MKNLTFLFSVLFTANALAEIPAGVYEGVSKFSFDSQQLPADYVQKIPKVIHQLLIQSENKFIQEAGSGCSDMTNVQYIEEFQSSNNSVINEFEAGFLRIEVARCFKNSTAEKVLTVMNSKDFKSRAFEGVVTFSEKIGTDSTCETSKAPNLGRSYYCYKDFFELTKSGYLQLFTFNHRFEITDQYQVPVYFRESLVTTRQMGLKVQLHSVTYARGPRLTNFQRIFAKSFIANAQTDVFDILAADLR